LKKAKAYIEQFKSKSIREAWGCLIAMVILVVLFLAAFAYVLNVLNSVWK